MNQWEALKKLDCVRPDSDDLSDPEFADAVKALDGNPAARQEFNRRLELDVRISAAMQDVAVPDGLHERLMQLTTGTPGNTATTDSSSATPARRSRRWILAGTLTAAAVLVAGIFIFRSGDPQTIPFDVIVANAPGTAQQVAEEAARTTRLPDWTPPRWLTRMMNQPGIESAGWTPEGFSDPLAIAVAGPDWVLVVAPRERVAGADNLAAASTFTRQGCAVGAWDDSRFVFALFVNGTEHDLRRVQRRFQASA